jgi:uncharacterized protein (TIGR02231 family)
MTQLETDLIAVVVYPDRARLTRQGSINLVEGSHQLEIQDLPIQMNPDSARIAARGTARARLMGLQVQRTFYSETPAEQARELESQLEAAQDELLALEAQLTLVGQNRARIEALAGHTKLYAKALGTGKMELEAQLALFDGLRKQAARLDSENLELLAGKRRLERRIEQLTNQLDQIRSSRPRERYSALAEVEVSQAGELALELSYVVSGAGWKPLYDLRLSEQGSGPLLEVGYLAQVTQQSGESWEAVTLTLSTARPALAATVPELEPWYIQPAIRPVPRAASQAAPDARGMREGAMKFAAAPAPIELGAGMAGAPVYEAEEAAARVEQSGAAISYGVPGKVSIPADGAPHKVTVARYSLPPKLDYVSAPGLVPAVYRRAKAVNDSPYTLLAGKANLFAGDEFIGSADLDLTPPQGEMELFLGVDDRLKIERELKRREVDKTILGGKRRIRYGYEIRLENLLESQARLTVHDQIPVARNEEIKVKLDTCEPKATAQSELNLLDWELELAAKEKRTLRFDFSVEFPQAMEVKGLP